MSHIATQSWLIDRRRALRGLGSFIALLDHCFDDVHSFICMLTDDLHAAENGPNERKGGAARERRAL